MGLDPSTVEFLSPLLGSLCLAESPRIILALRPQDPIPDWITHVVRLANDFRIIYKGLKGRDNIKMLKLEREKRKLIGMSLQAIMALYILCWRRIIALFA